MKKHSCTTRDETFENFSRKFADIEEQDYVCDHSEYFYTPEGSACSYVTQTTAGTRGADMISPKHLHHWRAVTVDSGYCDSAVGNSSRDSLSTIADKFDAKSSQDMEVLVPKKCLLEEFDMAQMSLSASPVSSRLRSSISFEMDKAEKKHSRLSLDSYQSRRISLLQSENNTQAQRDRSKLRHSIGENLSSKQKRRSSGVSVLMTDRSEDNFELSITSGTVLSSKSRRKCRRSLDSSISSSFKVRESLCKLDEDKVYVDNNEAFKAGKSVNPVSYVHQSSCVPQAMPDQQANRSYIDALATPSRRMRLSNYIRPKTPKKVSISEHDIVQQYNIHETPVKRTPNKNKNVVSSIIKILPNEKSNLRNSSQSTPAHGSRLSSSSSMSPNEWIKASPTESTESAVALASCTRRLSMGCSDLPQQSASCSLTTTAMQIDLHSNNESVQDSLIPLDVHYIDRDSGFFSENSSSFHAACFPSDAVKHIGAVPCVLAADSEISETKRRSTEYNTRYSMRHRESQKSVANKMIGSSPHDVIGRRMDTDFVDIISELYKRNITGVLSEIFSQLQSSDLISVRGVSRGWREAALSDRSSESRIDVLRKAYENPDNKENHNHSVKSRKPRMTESKRLLADVQLAEPDSPSTSKMKTRSASNAEKFWQEAGKLNRTGECLVKCPRCQKPAVKDCSQERGRCSNAQCKLDFCTKCQLVSHPSSVCTMEMGRRLRSDCIVGNKKSKQNLRRL